MGDEFIILVQLPGGADRIEAEHARHAVDGLLNILKIAHIDAAVAQPDAGVQRRDRLFHVVGQLVQKIRPILTLQMNLAEANQQNLSHNAFISF